MFRLFIVDGQKYNIHNFHPFNISLNHDKYRADKYNANDFNVIFCALRDPIEILISVYRRRVLKDNV